MMDKVKLLWSDWYWLWLWSGSCWAYNVHFKPVFDQIIKLHILESSLILASFAVQCTRGSEGWISRTAIGWCDKLLTCQRFWSADSGSCTVEAEQWLDSPTSVPFFSLRQPEVANRASECYGDRHKTRKNPVLFSTCVCVCVTWLSSSENPPNRHNSFLKSVLAFWQQDCQQLPFLTTK